MALIFPGKTICQLCNKVIEKEDKTSAFPAFLPNTHALGKYSDAAFHATCWESCPDNEWMEELYYLYTLICDTRPRNLKTLEEMEAWSKEAFQDWPPKGRVVIFESLDKDSSDDKFFYMDADSYQAFCEEEEKAQKELEERQEEALRQERESWHYTRDDDY